MLANNVTKIGEMRMISSNKGDPVKFILFLILKSLFTGNRVCFGGLSTDNFVLIFTVLKIFGQFRRAALKQGIRRANTPQTNGLTARYVLAYVRRVTTGGEEGLVHVSWLAVEICLKSTVGVLGD